MSVSWNNSRELTTGDEFSHYQLFAAPKLDIQVREGKLLLRGERPPRNTGDRFERVERGHGDRDQRARPGDP